MIVISINDSYNKNVIKINAKYNRSIYTNNTHKHTNVHMHSVVCAAHKRSESAYERETNKTKKINETPLTSTPSSNYILTGGNSVFSCFEVKLVYSCFQFLCVLRNWNLFV